MATDKIQTGLRLKSNELSKIAYIAKRQRRSLNAQLEFIVQECIEDYEAKYGEITLPVPVDEE